MGVITASGINGIEHLDVFDLIAEYQLAQLNIESILVYLVDTVDASALYFLAEQFDVLGYKGYLLADTDQKKRDLIKSAIDLHRFKGTPYSIRHALELLGYQNILIRERMIGATHNGAYSHNGTISRNQPSWVHFSVFLDGLTTGIIGQPEVEIIKKLIDIYKPARCHLWEVGFYYGFNENMIYSDQLSLDSGGNFADYMGQLHHNGAVLRDGSATYADDADILTINII